jgi:ankyrin repeat protein
MDLCHGDDIMQALHLAANAGHIKVVETLIANDAAINQQNAAGFTALHLASKRGDPPTVALLLKAHADTDVLTFKPKVIKSVDLHGARFWLACFAKGALGSIAWL